MTIILKSYEPSASSSSEKVDTVVSGATCDTEKTYKEQYGNKPDSTSGDCSKTSNGKSAENKDSKGNSGVSEEAIKLKREIGLLEAVAITVGSIIGSGIFISPKGIVQYVGSIGASLVIWAVCGLLSLVGALCYAELGTMFPSAGGAYTYLYESFGPATAFMYLWMTNVIGVPLGNAILALTFSKYVAQPFFPVGSEIPDMAIRLLSAAVVLLLTVINCQGVRQASRLINVFMYLKIFALGVIIAGGVCIVGMGEENKENVENIWSDTKLTAESVVYAIFSGMFAFGGWQVMSSMMEELKEPEKNLPRAIIISIVIVTSIYILTNIAYFTVLTPAAMLSSDAVAVTFISHFWIYLVGVIPVFVAVSTMGSLSIHIMTSARHCYVGARCGHFPSSLALISVEHRTPVSSIIFLSILTVLFMYTSDVFALINLLAVGNNLFQVAVYASSIYFHYKRPDIHRPFKIPVALPMFKMIVSALFFIIPVYVQPLNAAISVLLILPGLPIYYLTIARGKIPPWIRNLDEWTTITTQKLLIAVKEE